VFHEFIGEKLEKSCVKKIVKKIAESFCLPYYTITPTFSICPIHGYIAGEHEFCPICAEIEESDKAVGEVQTIQPKKEVKNEN
jgi:ribonucleoside-triphosphate reductase